MGRLIGPRPLGPEDDRTSFDCGRSALNNWFSRNAWRNQVSGASRTSVLVDTQTGLVVAFVSISAAEARRAHFPKALQRNQPDPLPAFLIGQLAVDVAWQRQGCARRLMRFALATAVQASTTIGCFCVLTQPLDDEVRRFYREFGLEDLQADPGGSMAVRLSELVRNGFG